MLKDGPSNSAGNVDSISFSRYPQNRSYYSQAMSHRPRANTRKLHEDKCSHCGKEKHHIEKCPTKDVECYHYKRKGHYSSLCFFKKNLASLEDYIEDNSNCDTSFLT